MQLFSNQDVRNPNHNGGDHCSMTSNYQGHETNPNHPFAHAFPCTRSETIPRQISIPTRTRFEEYLRLIFIPWESNFQTLGQICCKSKASPVDVAPAAAAEGHVGCGGTASAASRGRSGAARPRDPLRLPLPWDHRGRARSAAPWPLF